MFYLVIETFRENKKRKLQQSKYVDVYIKV